MTTPVEISYRTTQVQTRMLAVKVSATGTLQPLTQSEVSNELSGVVRSVPTEENYRVAHGDTLAQLYATHILAQFDRVEANEAATQALETAEAGVGKHSGPASWVPSLVAAGWMAVSAL